MQLRLNQMSSLYYLQQQMLKQSRYLSGDSFKPTQIPRSVEKLPSRLDYSGLRPASNIATQPENYAEQRFQEIKKKYGIKEKLTTEPYESRALREISLRTSNCNTFKNKESTQKYGSALVSKSIIVCPSSLRENPSAQLSRKPSIQQSIVRRVDQSRDIPRFGGRGIAEDVTIPSRSIQIPSRQVKQERVGSIDKINMKIYQILNCLNENTHGKQFDKSKLDLPPKNEAIPRPDAPQKHYKPEFTKSKVYVETNQEAVSKYYVPGRASRRTDPPIQEKIRRYSANPAPESTVKMKNSYLPQDLRKEGLPLKNKNIDEEIRKIEERIKKSEQEKKKLDINFPTWKDYQLPRRLSFYAKAQEPSAMLLEKKDRLYGNANSFKLKTQEVQKPPASVGIRHSQRLYTEQRLSNRRNETSRDVPKADLPQADVETSKAESKRLIEMLKKQVELDENLRNAKVVLSSTGIKDKQNLIKQALDKKGISLSLPDIQRQFEVTPEEHNPFFSVRDSNQSIEELARKYYESYQNWAQNLKGKFSYEQLKRQGFSEQKMDLEKKGFIIVEDMVRFLNFQTKNFYRNRDVILLFRRVSRGSSIRFSELMETLCR